MSLITHAILFTVFVWWFTTGAIIFLDGLPQRTFVASMAFASAVGAMALHGLWATSSDVSVSGAYWAFTCALLAWGWNEMGFLMGLITGPRTTDCPADLTRTQRLNFAIQAVAYHEIAIALTALVIFALTMGGANQVGLWTFMLLWVMRFSAKLNVYLGVPNITEEFLPPHLKYLKTYFRKRAMNALFPVSVTLTTLLAAWLALKAGGAQATGFETTGYTLLATLAVLALVEHWFMVLPIPATALWQWGLTSHMAQAADGADVLKPSILPADLGAVAAFQDATHQVLPSPIDHAAKTLALGAAPGSKIVEFPTLTPATHRRRP